MTRFDHVKTDSHLIYLAVSLIRAREGLLDPVVEVRPVPAGTDVPSRPAPSLAMLPMSVKTLGTPQRSLPTGRIGSGHTGLPPLKGPAQERATSNTTEERKRNTGMNHRGGGTGA